MNKEIGRVISFKTEEKEIVKIPSGSKIIGIWPDVAERELGKHKKKDKERKD